MNEERIIRITDEEYKKWQKFVRDFDDELKDYDVPKQLWVFFESKNLEPAPPKDCPMRSVDEIMGRLKSPFNYAVELGECTPEGIEDFRRWLTSQK